MFQLNFSSLFISFLIPFLLIFFSTFCFYFLWLETYAHAPVEHLVSSRERLHAQLGAFETKAWLSIGSLSTVEFGQLVGRYLLNGAPVIISFRREGRTLKIHSKCVGSIESCCWWLRTPPPSLSFQRNQTASSTIGDRFRFFGLRSLILSCAAEIDRFFVEDQTAS